MVKLSNKHSFISQNQSNSDHHSSWLCNRIQETSDINHFICSLQISMWVPYDWSKLFCCFRVVKKLMREKKLKHYITQF